MKLLMFVSILTLMSGCSWHAKEARTKSQMNQLLAGFAIYEAEFGSLPAFDAKTIMREMYRGNPKKWSILAPDEDEERAGTFLDAWGRPFEFALESEGLTIVSAGPDGQFGTSDDIMIRKK